MSCLPEQAAKHPVYTIMQSSRDTLSFHDLAKKAAGAVGSPMAFVVACAIVVAWLATGPLFRYSDTWQLIINTGTTIVTFLMVFLIQNTQNRDAKALHLKLDELLRMTKSARNRLIDLEDCTDEELAALQQQFERLRKENSGGPPSHREQSDPNS
jgi:low affinity Fe/Cu permease